MRTNNVTSTPRIQVLHMSLVCFNMYALGSIYILGGIFHILTTQRPFKVTDMFVTFKCPVEYKGRVSDGYNTSSRKGED